MSSILLSGFLTWNPTATPLGSSGVDSVLGLVIDFLVNASSKTSFHAIIALSCQQLQLFDNKYYPAWTDHVWRESDNNNGVKDHADDTIPGFCCSYLLKFCPYALHSHGHPNVNNPVPGHFLSNTNSPVSHICDLVRLLCLS